MNVREISSDNYCIEEQIWLCDGCAHRFIEYAPSNCELVCFDGEDGQRYFLPVYGRNGYLELMKKLIPERDMRKPVYPDAASEFVRRLRNVTTVCLSSPKTPPRCPICCSTKTTCAQRTVLHNHPVLWVSIDLDFLRSN